MTLTYWACEQTDDAPCYNIRTKTKRDATAIREHLGVERYSKPFKVTIEYRDAFDLMSICLGEGSVGEFSD